MPRVGRGQPRVLIEQNVVEDAELGRVARARHATVLGVQAEHRLREDPADLGLGQGLVVTLEARPVAGRGQDGADVCLDKRGQHWV